jgi:branched-chain amino acid transport system permease protein
VEKFLQLMLSGWALGAIYSIVALGFVLVFKATSVLNFAHGSFLMLAAYLATTFLVVLDMPFIVGLTIIAVMLALLGVILHYSIMQWMVGKPFFAVVLVTVGMEIVIRALLLVLYGPLERGKIQKLTTGTIEIGGAVVPTVNIIIFIAAIAVVVAFLAFFRLTRMGLHMRAVAENLEAATAMGINPNTVYATAWGIGLLLAGVGGVLYAHFTASIDLNLSVIGLRAFPAAILGGLDSIPGAIVGGMVVALIENIGSGYVGGEWRDVIAFGIMFLVLMWRPSGLFGTKELVRV